MKKLTLIDPTIDDQIVLMQELQQAKVRCVFTGFIALAFVVVNFSVSKYQNSLDSGEIYKGLASILTLAWGAFQILFFKFHKNIRPSTGRIIFGQFTDVIALSVVLSSGEVGGMCFVGFLWIILGNGMRFGRRLLMTCQVLSPPASMSPA